MNIATRESLTVSTCTDICRHDRQRRRGDDLNRHVERFKHRRALLRKDGVKAVVLIRRRRRRRQAARTVSSAGKSTSESGRAAPYVVDVITSTNASAGLLSCARACPLPSGASLRVTRKRIRDVAADAMPLDARKRTAASVVSP